MAFQWQEKLSQVSQVWAPVASCQYAPCEIIRVDKDRIVLVRKVQLTITTYNKDAGRGCRSLIINEGLHVAFFHDCSRVFNQSFMARSCMGSNRGVYYLGCERCRYVGYVRDIECEVVRVIEGVC